MLPSAIQSVLAQTLQEFELIVVGDGCTGNTNAVVNEFDEPEWLQVVGILDNPNDTTPELAQS